MLFRSEEAMQEAAAKIQEIRDRFNRWLDDEPLEVRVKSVFISIILNSFQPFLFCSYYRIDHRNMITQMFYPIFVRFTFNCLGKTIIG